MSDSSGREDRPVGLRLEEIVEAEQVVGEQAPEEAALGEKERAGARGRAAPTTAAWTAPGAVWLSSSCSRPSS